jgi:hypothetical protein
MIELNDEPSSLDSFSTLEVWEASGAQAKHLSHSEHMTTFQFLIHLEGDNS